MVGFGRGLLLCAYVAGGGMAHGQAPGLPVPSGAPVSPGAAAAVQAGPARGQGRPAPIVSPEVRADGRVTFRIFAPEASAVAVSGDIRQGLNRPAGSAASAGGGAATAGAPAVAGGPGAPAIAMSKGVDGVWSGTTELPMKAGAWRYHFTVDGMTAVDSRNVLTSPYQAQMESLLLTPGDFSSTRDVPHGDVDRVHYVASTLGGVTREMYVYTPPGYEKGTGTYPVLYLIHGGGETAASWSTVGRANDILDNLIADGKAVPMIVVMPSGWTPKGGQVMTSDATKDPFNDEMMKDIIPYMEGHFRVKARPAERALGGLSMGGIQTLNIGLHNLGSFDYLLVMSSGWISDADRDYFYRTEAARIPTYNAKLKLFWWGWGETDIARPNALKVTGRLKEMGVKVETMETADGHEWKNWRLYLHETAPMLFRGE